MGQKLSRNKLLSRWRKRRNKRDSLPGSDGNENPSSPEGQDDNGSFTQQETLPLIHAYTDTVENVTEETSAAANESDDNYDQYEVFPDEAIQPQQPLPERPCQFWCRHSGQQVISCLPPLHMCSYKKRRNVAEILAEAGNHWITHLAVKDNLPRLNLLGPHLTHLGISDLNDASQLDQLSQLEELETLDLCNVNLFPGMPSAISELRNLKKLSLSSCKLRTLPEWFAQFHQLEALDLTNNSFFRELPPVICQMRSLEKLFLNSCQLSELPKELAQLDQLEILDLSENEFSGILPPIVGKLKSLKKLNLKNCQLTDLPIELGALTSLEELTLSENDFSLGLPPAVTQMLSLEVLILGNASSGESSGCRLLTLPDVFEKLENLRHLDVSYNKFAIFPSAIYELSKLRTLKLRGNRKLKQIEKKLQQLPNLQELDIRDCESLKYPPEAVCEQGLTAVKQYFKDLEKGKETKLSSVPVAVIGASLSGKTSIIRSLQAEERKLTFRDESSAKDEATKVFDVQALHFEEFSVKFIDYGGHDIYHVAYDVAKKDLCLPIVVVNMKQFADMSAERNSKETTRKLLFDWLSHLYVACPRLGPPILVLTHADQFSTDSFLEHRAVLENDAETIKSDILKEENQLSKESPGVLRHIDHFRQTDQPFIHSDDIFVFSNDMHECENIQQLRDRILNRCRDFSNVIPEQWNTVEQYVKSVDSFHVDLSAIKRQRFQVEDIIVVLRYLHNSGSILWFDMHRQLSDYVFYNIPAIVNMIATLFHHSADKEWENRQKDFIAFYHRGVKIEIAKYRELIQEFTQNGLLAEALLVHLMDANKFPVEIAICLLKAFCIVHGPLKDRLTSYYIVPYFAEEQMPDDWETNDHLKLRMEMRFRGLAPPKYVFHQVTVTVLNCMAFPLSVVDIYRQGATVRYRDNVMHLVHSFLTDMFTLQISTTLEELGDSWYQLLKTCCTVLQALQSAWPASRVEMLMYCVHCLAVNDKEPSHVADPGWLFSGGKVDFDNIRTYAGTDKVACKRCKGKDGKLVPAVPCPLVYPCYDLSEEDIEVVKRFLTGLKKPPTCAVQQPTTQSNESDSELSDSLDYMDEDKESLDIIRLSPKPTTRPDIVNLFSSQSVYEMSFPVRGRCLIINNQHFEVPTATDQTRLGSRPGSETDAENLRLVLISLSFHCGEVKTDVSSQNMLEMIKQETKDPSHKNYGMFVLVIMSHGTETTIFGSDGRSVELSQIYDLMSPFKFEAMKDKPKWIILQACSGVRRDLMTDAVPSTSSSQAAGRVPPQPAPRSVNAPYTSQTSGGNRPTPAPRQHSAHPPPRHGEPPPPRHDKPPPPDNQSTDDLFIMRASFPSYVSIRHERNGSWFIRALVEALYKHACHRDLDTLFHQQVRKKVSRKSLAVRRHYKGIGGQQPLIITTPTKGRKLYLFPGYEPESSGEDPVT